MTALTMGLGQERANGRKEGENKELVDDTAMAKELSHGTRPETSERQR